VFIIQGMPVKKVRKHQNGAPASGSFAFRCFGGGGSAAAGILGAAAALQFTTQVEHHAPNHDHCGCHRE
jgi:hypothetical protein